MDSRKLEQSESAESRTRRAVPAVASVVGTLAVAVWLGGLLALGAVVAPLVFANVSFPQSADAMTLVFRRFDGVAMTCAALAMASEAVKVAARADFRRLDHLRAGVTVVASVLAVVEGTLVSPRIAALHAAGVMRGMGTAGETLSRLHDVAEALGKTEVVLLAVVLALLVVPRPAR
jgi:choline dehydrogenase-like flavoprotein